jgi:hypothetical protein
VEVVKLDVKAFHDKNCSFFRLVWNKLKDLPGPKKNLIAGVVIRHIPASEISMVKAIIDH